MHSILRYEDILARYPVGTWQDAAARDAVNHLTGHSGHSFPCVFAVRAMAQDGYRYCFAADSVGSNMASALTDFLRNARDIGPYASLSYIFPPEQVQSLEAYHDRFWRALKQLHAADETPWPSDIPYSLQDPDWTFCFDGEPIFPLCLTPAHINRRTRYAQNFTISFQPRWTFKHHLPDMGTTQKYSKLIRDRMKAFDTSSISPYLGIYGTGVLDAEKYFFHDTDTPMGFPDNLD